MVGLYPLYITTKDRVANQLNLYIDSVAPHFVPGGGGFSLTVFTLNGLYEQFQKARAWWTTDNSDLPLIRYTGCKIKLFRAESSDYIFSYVNCYPMQASLETYQGTQPTIQLLNNKHKIMTCKKHNSNKKPYKNN